MEKTDLGEEEETCAEMEALEQGCQNQTSARPLTQHRIPEMSQYKNKSFNSTSVFFIAEAALYL